MVNRILLFLIIELFIIIPIIYIVTRDSFSWFSLVTLTLVTGVIAYDYACFRLRKVKKEIVYIQAPTWLCGDDNSWED